MNDCETVRTDLGAYVLGGLSESEADRVEAHLATCSECRTERDELAPLPGLLELTVDEPPPVPADLRDRIVAHAARAPRTKSRTLLVAAAAALVGLLVGGGVVLAVLADPPPDRRVALSADDAVAYALAGEATLRDTSSGVRLDLEASGLRFDPDVAYYHVWLERPDGRRVSAGTALRDDEGRLEASLTCGGALEEYTAVAITSHHYLDSDGQLLVRAALE